MVSSHRKIVRTIHKWLTSSSRHLPKTQLHRDTCVHTKKNTAADIDQNTAADIDNDKCSGLPARSDSRVKYAIPGPVDRSTSAHPNYDEPRHDAFRCMNVQMKRESYAHGTRLETIRVTENNTEHKTFLLHVLMANYLL